ncbi:unnamed protein product, partial [marine sediment metagenome]
MKTKLTILMPKELHIAVKVKAAKEDTTISEVVRELLRQWLEEEKER